ncbi:hypothetical protein L4D09_28620, partial [Photobacterium makurazakiensis]|uniref:hypothetical protein n=1 Tax=Photobacterium makurazakiensis TaxID=2910234 RepID=UPI003D0A4702
MEKRLVAYSFITFSLFNIGMLINTNEPEVAVLIYQISYLFFIFNTCIYLYNNPNTFHSIAKFNAIFFTLFLTGHYLYCKTIGVPFYIYANEIFFEQSRNSVSWYAIFSMLFYAYSCMLLGEKAKVIYLIPLVFYCLILYGRSGIALALASLILIVTRGSISKLLMLSILAGIVIIYNLPWIQDAILETNFSRGFESPRSMINSEFMNSLNLKTFFLGVNIWDVPTAFGYGGN